MRTTILGQLSVPERAGRETAFTAGVVLLWAVYALILLAPGGVRIDVHEGDAMHLAAAVLRMADHGQVPHLDFSTPLGPLAFAPIAAFVAAGQGLGLAFVSSQIALGALLLPVLVWIARTRAVSYWVSGGLAALVLSLAMALTHGEADGSLSVSMHYNRWGWAIGFAVLALAIWPPRQGSVTTDLADGLVIGIGMALLVLIKVTYAVAFAPAIAAALLQGRVRGLGVAIGTASLLLSAFVAALGPAWVASYLLDLVAVTRPDARPSPGVGLAETLATPRMVTAILAGLAAAILLRLRGADGPGLVLLLLVPGLVFVTWQNFGNDPQWLPFVALTLWAVGPAGDAGAPLRVLAVAILALGLPSAVNSALSPARHAGLAPDAYVALLPGVDAGAGLAMKQVRAEEVRGLVELEGFPVERIDDPLGRELPECQFSGGVVAMQAGMSEALITAGFRDRAVLVTDLYSHVWIFGAGPPLRRGAPWQYDGLPGGDAAELLAVPLCPFSLRLRKRMLKAVQEAGWQVREVHSDRFVRLFEITGR